MNSQGKYYNPSFSHIYVERKICKEDRTKRILEKFPGAQIIPVDHYKDVFCRTGQNAVLQHHSQNLILAEKQGELIYQGAPVCQNFGHENFYYTSCIMNCPFDCEYCYLKGMYASSNLVIFINIEDIFREVEKLLEQHPVYLCVSYDTDLLALENVVGYTGEWITFSKRMKEKKYDLKIEIRTKCANAAVFEKMPVDENCILAFTMSPQYIIEQYEHHTAPLRARIKAVKQAMELGMPVRLCFDPMLYCKDWPAHYGEMLKMIEEEIDLSLLMDVSVGSFRVSQEYLKKMRKLEKNSAIVQFPYVNTNGYYHYPKPILKEMEEFMEEWLGKRMAKNQIFRWNA
ncbi:MAG: SPL family radical SAM protein [Lachnospiraceae bacterium]